MTAVSANELNAGSAFSLTMNRQAAWFIFLNNAYLLTLMYIFIFSVILKKRQICKSVVGIGVEVSW